MLTTGERAYLFFVLCLTENKDEFIAAYNKLTSKKNGASAWWYVTKFTEVDKARIKRRYERLKQKKKGVSNGEDTSD